MSHDEEAIRTLIDTFVTGWNAGNGARLASVFSENADFTAITGLHARGREVITKGHDEILSTIYRGTNLWSEVELVDFLKPDVALVNVKFFLQKHGHSFFPGVTSTSCGIVALRTDGAWEFAAFRNMVPFARPVAGPVERELLQASPANSLSEEQLRNI